MRYWSYCIYAGVMPFFKGESIYPEIIVKIESQSAFILYALRVEKALTRLGNCASPSESSLL